MNYSLIEKSEDSLWNQLIVKPFSLGVQFGIGYCIACVVLQHPWNSELIEFGKQIYLKKMLKAGTTTVRSVANEIAQQTANEAATLLVEELANDVVNEMVHLAK